MNEKVLKYRKRHKKCIYCTHLRYNSRAECCGGCGYFYCKAKDKIIKSILPDMTRVPRWFCQCYEVKDENKF